MDLKMTDQARYRGTPWGLVLFEGLMALLFALLFLLEPGATLFILAETFGLLLFIGGIITLLKIGLDSRHWGYNLVIGILGILAGGVIMTHPLINSVILPTSLAIVVGVLGLIMGVLKILHAFQGSGWYEAVIGVLYVLIGMVLLGSPFLAGLNLPLVLGLIALAVGLILVYMAFRLRSQREM